MTQPIPPGRWRGDHLGETRWVLEAARLTVDPVWHGRGGIPPGDGRAVVLVPGFLGGDHTLAALAGWLRRIGSRPARSGRRAAAARARCPPHVSRADVQTVGGDAAWFAAGGGVGDPES